MWIPTKVERSFGRDGKRPPSRVGIVLPVEGTMRLGMTKMTMESPRLTWDSHRTSLNNVTV
jgi:hypothetical protein